jgi:glycerate kinase
LTAGANDPMTATTTGVGELIRAAIEAGAQRIMVGAGGSATTDGGWGAVEVLREFGPLDGTRGYRVIVATDVTSDFVAAAAEFGPQKGASPAQVVELAERLRRLTDRYLSEFGVDVRGIAGAGAAGGFAGGLAALGAQLQPGFALVADEIRLAERIAQADLVLTGEGRFDASTLAGKAPAGVLALARKAGVRAVVVAGARDPATVPPPDVTVISLAERFGAERALRDTLACVSEVVSDLLRRDAS